MNKKIIITAIVAIVLIIVGFRLLSPEDSWVCNEGRWVKHGEPSEPMPTKSCPGVPAVILATFNCPEGKSIEAKFNNGEHNSVDLKLSDGRSFSLLQATSASGVRYANPDESFVFWNKGDNAFISESDNLTYDNCVAK